MAEEYALTVVGLGPGPDNLWTGEVRDAVGAGTPIWLRTRRHGSSDALARLRPDAQDFDDVYESAPDLPSVYGEIVARLTAMAARVPLVYAVPGSPVVGEESVRLLRAAATAGGLRYREMPGVTFLDAMLANLGWDALDGLQIADAMAVARHQYPPLDPDRPAVLAQLHGRMLASDVKLVLLAAYPPDHVVTVIRADAQDAARTHRCALAELDHYRDFDDETSLAVPPLACTGSSNEETRAAARSAGPALPIGGGLATLGEMMARLRAPDGCPWDLEQTHLSLRPFLLEEAYETLAALDAEDPYRLKEELGDLLLQVVFHAQIASEAGDFTLGDVVCGLTTKIVARHPHVFAGETALNAGDVLVRWEELKRAERAEKGAEPDPFAGIAREAPALSRAQQIQERAHRAGLPVVAAPDEPDAESRVGMALWDAVAEARAAGIDAEDALRMEVDRRLKTARVAAAGDLGGQSPSREGSGD